MIFRKYSLLSVYLYKLCQYLFGIFSDISLQLHEGRVIYHPYTKREHPMNAGQQQIAVNGVHIGVIEHGKRGNPPLVLLHGFTGSAASWGTLLTDLAAYQSRSNKPPTSPQGTHKGCRDTDTPRRPLRTIVGASLVGALGGAGDLFERDWAAHNLHVIALDMLGHGQSAAPTDPARYSIEHCQTDIIAVLQSLGIRSGEAILLGYSMGGRIALYCAFSGFFRALILESASPGLAHPLERVQCHQSDMALADRIEREGIPAFVAYWEQLPLFASQRSLPKEKQATLHAQRLHNRATGLANSLRGIGTGIQPALHAQLPTLTIPVLLITGELDTKFCALAEQMQQALPLAQWSVMPGAGHAVHLEQAALFVRDVAGFCRSVVDKPCM